jgi:hypothetical protein
MSAPTPGTVTEYAFNQDNDTRNVTVDATANLLLVVVQERFTRGGTVTCGGASMTLLNTGGTSIGGTATQYIFYLANPTTGTPSIAISGLSAAERTIVGVLPVIGADLTTIWRTQTGSVNFLTQTGNPGPANSSITLTTVADDLAVSTLALIADTDETLTAGLTQQWQDREYASPYAIRAGGQTGVATGTTKACAWTFTAQAHTHVALAIMPAAASAPANTVAPAVTGTTEVGSTLSCSTGTWTDDGSPTFTYQWKNAAGDIAGATSSTYVLVSGDAATSIHCTVTDTDTNGATSADSNTVGPITWPAPTNTVAPTVSGSAVVGSTLTAGHGTWTDDGSPTFTYQWWQGTNASPIVGATSSTYTTVSGDIGAAVGCTVTDTDSGGATAADSSNTVTVTAGPIPGDTATMLVTIL